MIKCGTLLHHLHGENTIRIAVCETIQMWAWSGINAKFEIYPAQIIDESHWIKLI